MKRQRLSQDEFILRKPLILKDRLDFYPSEGKLVADG